MRSPLPIKVRIDVPAVCQRAAATQRGDHRLVRGQFGLRLGHVGTRGPVQADRSSSHRAAPGTPPTDDAAGRRVEFDVDANPGRGHSAPGATTTPALRNQGAAERPRGSRPPLWTPRRDFHDMRSKFPTCIGDQLFGDHKIKDLGQC